MSSLAVYIRTGYLAATSSEFVRSGDGAGDDDDELVEIYNRNTVY